MDSLSLCMLAPEFFPVWGGTGSYIIELLKFLPMNVDIHVLTLRRDIPEMSKDSNENNDVSSVIDRPMKIHYLSKSKETFFYNLPFQIACFSKIPALHKKYRFDIIHSHLCHMPDVFLRLFNKINVPTILTVHGTIQMLREHALIAQSRFSDLESGEARMLKFYPIIKSLQQEYVKHVARFIAVSNATKVLAIKHLGIDEEKINVVYNGVDTNIFTSPTNKELETKYSSPTVLYVGRMVSKKGIHSLIKSMPQILRAFPRTRFLFAGSGNISLYKEILRKMRISEKNYHFLGQLGYFDRPKIFREATVFVNPSFFENCSISILEAMASGSAVVANNVGGNSEIIETGKNGLLVPAFDDKRLAEAIISLLKNETFNRKISREARKTIETTFSSTTFAEKTYEIYKQTLNRSY